MSLVVMNWLLFSLILLSWLLRLRGSIGGHGSCCSGSSGTGLLRLVAEAAEVDQMEEEQVVVEPLDDLELDDLPTAKRALMNCRERSWAD